MVYIERLYGDWNDDDIINSWVDQCTIDCCKLNSQDKTTNQTIIYTTNISNSEIKLFANKKLNTKMNITNVNCNGEYYRRNENFNKKLEIKNKRKYKGR